MVKYGKAEKQATTIGARIKAQSDLDNHFRKYVKTCRESMDKQRYAMTRMYDYEKPYLNEWKRLNDKYLSKNKSAYSEDDIPNKDRQNIKRQAAKNVGYDEKEYNRLKKDFEKARDNAEKECQKVVDQLIGKYGDTPVLNKGYANEETARDVVSNSLKRLHQQDYSNRKAQFERELLELAELELMDMIEDELGI